MPPVPRGAPLTPRVWQCVSPPLQQEPKEEKEEDEDMFVWRRKKSSYEIKKSPEIVRNINTLATRTEATNSKIIYANISYGRYLAKDDGFTYDFSRRTKSGFIAGFFFTRTDVPFELFGEGSFDKGFYFEMPLDIFSSKPNIESFNFGLRPLTRDGGAKLEFARPLRSVLIHNNYHEIMEGWDDID